MIILLSPAKTMDFSEISPSIASSEPRGYEDAEFLAKQLSQLSQSQLKALLKVNDGIARYIRHCILKQYDVKNRFALQI